ncbi:MAG: energy-coupling factor ABC transporter ATP-binding protein [Desulfitobacteriaceae bacterium]
MAELILEAVEVEYSYPDGTQALRKINMAVEKGKKVAILGSNGAGKSTLFLHFNGILRPAGGKIRYNGRDVLYTAAGLRELRTKVGIVFQDPDSQLFSASVWQEISFGPLNLGLQESEVKERVLKAMVETEIQNLADKPTHMLSFGQKKRVAIADILAMAPEVIIFDEPTAWLDPRHAREFMQLLDHLAAAGRTIIISTHDVDVAYAWADSILIIHHGQIVAAGAPTDVFKQTDLIATADLALPWLVELHGQLIRTGWLLPDAPLPQSKEELFAALPSMIQESLVSKNVKILQRA